MFPQPRTYVRILWLRSPQKASLRDAAPACRDLFDLHYLLEVKGTDQDDAWEMFEQKARHKKIDPANFFERFDVRVPQYEERWADEMGEHLGGDLPHFEAIRRELRRRLRPRR